MRRLRWTVIPFLVMTMLLPMTVSVSAQSVDPAPSVSVEQARLDVLSALLVPIHKAVKDSWAAVLQDASKIDGLSYRMLTSALLGKGAEKVAELAVAIAALEADLTDLAAAASSGVAALSMYPPAECFADYWAAERMAFRLIGDSVDSLAAGDMGTANAQVSIGLYLFNVQAELEFSVTSC